MTEELPPIRTTGIGSWPGTEVADAIKIAFAECPDLPYLPELPARGSHAQLVGRSTALLAGLTVDLQPAGWRLTEGSGREHRLAISTFRSDLDELEEQAQGYVGELKIAVGGPWTLAASMERPRGDRVLADHGARRDLGQSLAEGLADLVTELRRRLPDIAPLIQLDEPLLPAVLAGAVPTASGFSRHRTVDGPEIRATMTMVVERVARAGAPVAVHCCAADPPIGLLHEGGAVGVLVDLDQLRVPDWDVIGDRLEAGMWLGLGAMPTGRAPLTSDQVASRVLAPLRTLGLDPNIAAQLVITPACGLASSSRADAIQALRAIRTAAGIVTERLAD
jgi:methionine synthase II (cobalamin-independent)